MLGRMMHLPLIVSALIEHADSYHGDTEIVSRTVEGPIHRYTYREAHGRARRLAKALQRLGVGDGDRVATLAWNGYRHVELYYAVSGMGAVIHTVNPRLFPEQIAWIINDAADAVVCFDLSFAPLVKDLMQHCPGVRHWIALGDRAALPPSDLDLLSYEALLADETDDFRWPQLDENQACALCYTSGTTGHPNGVLYSHRSTMLHAMMAATPDALNLSAQDVVLPVVPMFHVNAWGLPYTCAMVGAKLVLPGPSLDGASLYELFEREQVTFTAGVPTVWLGVLQHLQKTGVHLSSLQRMIVGGSACPPALMTTFAEDYGVRLQHVWGMTELSPLGTVNSFKQRQLVLPPDERFGVEIKQGRPPFGIDLKIVDGQGCEQACDGSASGDLLVRGHWVVSSYYGREDDPLIDGWFPTGDVATLDPDGFMQITDRSKDVIKSGGEWISSIEVENVAMSHPAVAEAAAIGVAHPRWDERPLLVVVRKTGSSVTAAELLAHYDGRMAKWSVPDDVVFVDEIPHTATGKVSKLELRRLLSDYRWARAAASA
jgi:acyl-CoA synthetase (AMP-forming)/AMP-acid ligase II